MSDQQTEYFYLITFTGQGPGGSIGQAIYDGVATIPPGTTRKDMYTQIVDSIRAQDPDLKNYAVTFLSIEPNQL